MSSKPNPNQPPDGRVVYRRVVPVDPTPSSAGDGERRIDPTLLPLIAGFALLLLLILVLGNLSVRRLEDTSRNALQLEQSYAARTNLLLRLRVALTQLDHEERNRMETTARHELTPPFDLRLNTAQGKAADLLPQLFPSDCELRGRAA